MNIIVGQSPLFPRYLNELDIEKICIRFQDTLNQHRRISIVWSGGSKGRDRFQVKIDDITVGLSRHVDSSQRPFAWYRDDFICRLGTGSQHTLEISAPSEFTSSIEFAGIQMASTDAEVYQPLCYESISSLDEYEKAIAKKGIVVESDHLWLFAPHRKAAEAKMLARFLEKAYAEMKSIYGMDTLFKFSIEHYPKGHTKGWGGISGAGTIGFTNKSLERFGKLRTKDIRGFAGYTEEMSHGFKAYYRCHGTYEALGVAVQEDVTRKLVPRAVADAFWVGEHKKWNDTHVAYLAAGCKNPDPQIFPWNVLYTRILNALFLKLRDEYGPTMWPDFFRVIHQMDYPLHRTKDSELLKVYADIFSVLFGRDMRKEFTDFGIDLGADPPWGWETYKK